MPRDNDRVVACALDVGLGSSDHSTDAASGVAVDEWIVAVPVRVPREQYICLDEIDGKVAVSVGRPVISDIDGLAIEGKCLGSGDEHCWPGADGGGRKIVIPIFDARGRGQMCQRVFVRDDRGACGAQPLVAIRVIPVIVSVDQKPNGLSADAAECGDNFRP